MQKVYAYFKNSLASSLAYRLQFMSSIVISPLILSMLYFIWKGIFENNSSQSILGYSFESMISYYIVVMLIGHVIFNTVGNTFQEKVIYGNLNQDLLKPYPLMMQFLINETASRAFAFIVEFIPVLLISVVLFRLFIPSVLFISLFAVSVAFAFIINFMLGFFTGTLAFWLKDIGSIQWLMFFMVRFLSGEFIPLEFLGGFFAVTRYLPFYYLRYAPAQIYLQNITAYESVQILGIQVLWIFSLYLLCRLILWVGLKKYGAVGG